MKMSERWECLSSKSIELISKELNFLSLLLDNIHKLALMSDLLNALGWILRTSIISSLTLQSHNLLSLVHILLELASLCLQLFILLELILNLLL
jgi:hypothetical protein